MKSSRLSVFKFKDDTGNYGSHFYGWKNNKLNKVNTENRHFDCTPDFEVFLLKVRLIIMLIFMAL